MVNNRRYAWCPLAPLPIAQVGYTTLTSIWVVFRVLRALLLFLREVHELCFILEIERFHNHYDFLKNVVGSYRFKTEHLTHPLGPVL
jgi:hypothetical protein